jgi:carbonic anhydrase
VTLGCVDSRAPSEIIFDAGIGDMFARVKPAISATDFAGDKSSKNPTYVDAVARTNVLLGLEAIRRRSPILAELEQKRSIALVGGMYDVATGSVELLS